MAKKINKKQPETNSNNTASAMTKRIRVYTLQPLWAVDNLIKGARW